MPSCQTDAKLRRAFVLPYRASSLDCAASPARTVVAWRPAGVSGTATSAPATLSSFEVILHAVLPFIIMSRAESR